MTVQVENHVDTAIIDIQIVGKSTDPALTGYLRKISSSKKVVEGFKTTNSLDDIKIKLSTHDLFSDCQTYLGLLSV